MTHARREQPLGDDEATYSRTDSSPPEGSQAKTGQQKNVSDFNNPKKSKESKQTLNPRKVGKKSKPSVPATGEYGEEISTSHATITKSSAGVSTLETTNGDNNRTTWEPRRETAGSREVLYQSQYELTQGSEPPMGQVLQPVPYASGSHYEGRAIQGQVEQRDVYEDSHYQGQNVNNGTWQVPSLQSFLPHNHNTCKSAIQQKDAEIVRLQNNHNVTLSNLNDAVKELQENKMKWQSESMRQEKNFRRVQEQLFKNPQKSHWLGDQDSTIKRYIGDLQLQIKKFEKTHKANDFEALISTMDREDDDTKAGEYLSNFVRLRGSDIRQSLRDLHTKCGRAPMYVLGASIAYYLTSQIMNNPFFFLSNNEGILQLYKDLMLLNESEAHAWRSQALQILDPSMKKDNLQEKGNLEARGAVARKVKVQDLANRYLESNFYFLKDIKVNSEDPEEQTAAQREFEKRCSELLRIFDSAGELAYRLWMQRTYFNCETQKLVFSEPFDYHSEFLEAHPSHKLGHLDDEDEDEREDLKRFDGKTADIICFPAIFARGTNEGESYTQERVWKKAVIWMGEWN